MNVPTPSDLRRRSPTLSGKYPLPATPDGPDDPLLWLVMDATAAVQGFTGRILGPAGTAGASPWTECMELVPAGLEGVAYRAVTLMAEEIAVMAEVQLARRRASRLRLRGFTAGPYSEQYWDPGMVRGTAGSGGKRPTIVDDPDLDDMLWLLATEETRMNIMYTSQGIVAPAATVAVFDYRREGGGYFPSYATWRQMAMLNGPDGL